VQLRAVSRLSVALSGVDQGFQRKATLEEYRYDALGRRIWVRGVRTCDLDTNNPLECTISFVRRTVWDGNQELAEIQAPGAETQDTVWERDTGYVHLSRVQWGDGDPNRYYGRVVYTHGLAVDQPISVARFAYADYPFNGSYTPWNPFVVFPLWNLEGRPTLGIFSTGNGYQQYQTGGTACPDPPGTSSNRCLPIYWPLGWSAYDQQKGIPMPSWHGTLLEDKQDHAGTYYRRNRAYDPQSGRFTQEDPIGLAGGLNLYGFANGDPVNFSDPFGLFSCPPLCSERTEPGYVGSDPGLLDPTAFVGPAEIKFAAVLFGVAKGLAREGAERLVGFAAGRWLEHFEKHGAEVGAKTAVEYLRGANALIRGGKGVETFVRSGGDKLFYREATNEFGVLAKDGKTIRTYFKPREGRQYFDNQKLP
jgi:RHS repeat-associated protein